MKTSSFFFLLNLIVISVVAQDQNVLTNQENDIHALIEIYIQARQNSDVVTLENILTDDIDQLVSSGEWRKGKAESMKGMNSSTQSNPGNRSIKIENIRIIDQKFGIVDARYDRQNPDGTSRKMWSTFIVTNIDGNWKITAIRNMLIPD